MARRRPTHAARTPIRARLTPLVGRRHERAVITDAWESVIEGRGRVVSIIEELWDAGAGGVLLGCTELELLVKQADVELPVFPCTTLHVQAALDAALAEDQTGDQTGG